MVQPWYGLGAEKVGFVCTCRLTLRFPKNERNVLSLKKKALYLHPQIERRFSQNKCTDTNKAYSSIG